MEGGEGRWKAVEVTTNPRWDSVNRLLVYLLVAFAVGTAHAQGSRGSVGGRSADLGAPDEWYLPVADGCRLYVYELGRGPDTVVVLHGGFGAEHSYMLDAVRGLAERHRFVFYDQRGSLRSPCPDSTISIAKHVEDLERLRAELGLERLTLMCHSMGTVLAMSYLKAHPNYTGGLVLLGTVPPADVDDSAVAAKADSLKSAFLNRREIAATLSREGLDPPTEQLSAPQRTHAWRVRFAGANIYHVERWRLMKGGQVFYNQRAGDAAARTLPQPYDFVADLTTHPCSVTVVAGTHDIVDMGVMHHSRWIARVPKVRLEVIRNAGHNAWLDEPDQFRRLVGDGLARAVHCSG